MRHINPILSIILFCFASVWAASIEPLPQKLDVDPSKAALGKKLFSDTLLSADNTVSCATCHILEAGGDDNLPASFGINGQQGNINAPTVFNAVFNFRQFWNGRARDLSEQALGPIENPIEMGNTFENLINTLKRTPYKDAFAKIYPDGITKANIADAIAAYERTLITPNAPFDRYLRGEEEAISEDAKEGFGLFKEKGCIACHHGINVGGNLYNKFGLHTDAKSDSLGRFEVTGREEDKFVFKVPSLRNVAETAPYFHDGRTSSLVEAVKIMAMYQLGRRIGDDEIRKIVAFLTALSGQIPPEARE